MPVAAVFQTERQQEAGPETFGAGLLSCMVL